MSDESAPSPAGWEQVLDELEAQLLGAEAALRHGGVSDVQPWAAPRLSEPVPAHLAERARELLSRQHELCEELDGALAGLRRQRTVTDRIRQATGRRSGSVYVDVSA